MSTRLTAALLALGLSAALIGGLAPASLAASPATPNRIEPGNAWTSGVFDGQSHIDYNLRISTRGYYLMTLGDLVEDYDLEVRSAAGTVLTRSSRPGTTFEQSYRPMAVGDYVLRVVPKVSTPYKTFVLRAQRLAEGQYVLNPSKVDGSDPASPLAGQVINNATAWMVKPTLGVYFYDTAGRVMSAPSLRVHVATRNAAPRTLTPFLVTGAPSGYHRVGYRVFVGGDQLAGSKMPAVSSGFSVSYGPVGPDGVSRRGSVTNHTARGIEGFAAIVFYGRRGTVIGTNTPAPDGATGYFNAPPGGTGAFELTVERKPTAPISLTQYRVYANSVSQ